MRPALSQRRTKMENVSGEEAKVFFKFHGFLITPKLIPLPDLQAIEQTINGLLVNKDEKTAYQALQKIDSAQRLVFSPSLLSTARGLLNLKPDHPLYVTFKINYQAEDCGWHQESSYSIYQARQVSLWLPLIAKHDLQTGSIIVLSGSHLRGERPHYVRQRHDGQEYFYIPDCPTMRDYQIFNGSQFDLGDALWLHTHIIHQDSFNTGAPRHSLTANYIDPFDIRFQLNTDEEIKSWHRQRCVQHTRLP